ncbi:hypothetical protein SKAU_G00392190 [Synaphobranchus kaupii]|uniref:Uncharacterized protein n=1 Tax=Synaphobranchus kaupii TaxID=118154 RepID=A0A9Q1EBT1_SYNKA|nr:hypothetical protein SKAU_G00392190 [Synaphobranchus kaupii]
MPAMSQPVTTATHDLLFIAFPCARRGAHVPAAALGVTGEIGGGCDPQPLKGGSRIMREVDLSRDSSVLDLLGVLVSS